MATATKLRILVVEDNRATATDYQRWLQEEGYEVLVAEAATEAEQKAKAFNPEVILMDLQIPSDTGRNDEDVEHGFRTLAALSREKPFRPVVVVTAHSRDRELTRRVYQLTRGGQFVFKDADDPQRELVRAVTTALASPAYKASKIVVEFRELVERKEPENEYRKFIHANWHVLLGPEYKDCLSPHSISTGTIVDLLAIRHDGFADLWELKLPTDALFQSYNQWLHHSTECARAIGQLMEYYDLAEQEDAPGRRSYARRRGIEAHLHRPRGFVVIGRYQNEQERERLRLENSFFAGLTILTYDDLIERAEQLLSFLLRYCNGDAKTGGA